MNGNDSQEIAYASPGSPVGSVRWVVAGLLFLDTILNYIDYMSLAVLSPRIIEGLRMTDRQYGYVVLAFQISFMAMFLLGKNLRAPSIHAPGCWFIRYTDRHENPHAKC